MQVTESQQLQQMLQFESEDVLSRFMDMFDIAETEARDILKETIKFLYISQIPDVFIPDDLLILDEMWHNMILFTPQYHEFSLKHFNKYHHHVPAGKAEKEGRQMLLKADPGKAGEEYMNRLEVLISITYDHLGEETVMKWFQEYPEKYSPEKIKALRK